MQEARDCAKRLTERFNSPFHVRFDTWAGLPKEEEEWCIYSFAIMRSVVATSLVECEAQIIEKMEEKPFVPDIYAEDNEPCPF